MATRLGPSQTRISTKRRRRHHGLRRRETGSRRDPRQGVFRPSTAKHGGDASSTRRPTVGGPRRTTTLSTPYAYPLLTRPRNPSAEPSVRCRSSSTATPATPVTPRTRPATKPHADTRSSRITESTMRRGAAERDGGGTARSPSRSKPACSAKRVSRYSSKASRAALWRSRSTPTAVSSECPPATPVAPRRRPGA